MIDRRRTIATLLTGVASLIIGKSPESYLQSIIRRYGHNRITPAEIVPIGPKDRERFRYLTNGPD